MSKASEYIILCEDKLQGVFIGQFLKYFGIPKGIIRVIPYPSGEGAGEKHVRARYPKEVTAYRRQSARVKKVLIVVIDADTSKGKRENSDIGTVANRQNQLATTLKDEMINPRSEKELLVHLIPRRHIETWLACLDDFPEVNEKDRYKPRYEYHRKEKNAHPLFDRFAELFRSHKEPENCLPSLHEAMQELERLRNVLKSS